MKVIASWKSSSDTKMPFASAHLRIRWFVACAHDRISTRHRRLCIRSSVL